MTTAKKPAAKLSYIAIMLLAAGCLLLYIVRIGGSKTPADAPAKPGETAALPRPGPSPDSVMVSGDAAAIKKAIAAGMKIDAPLTVAPYAGLAPLHVVATRAVVGGVAALAAAGANVDVQAADGRTPLMIAAQQGFVAGVTDLVAANASVDMRDAKGQTALMLAAGAARTEAVQVLVKAGASINAADSSGATAIGHAATTPSNAAVISILIAAGADADVADAKGVTPLMRAAEHADTEQVVLLLNAGASPVGKSHDGRSALDRAKTRTDEGGRQVAGVLDQAGS